MDDDYQKPIRPIGEEDQDHLRIHPIERERKIKEDQHAIYANKNPLLSVYEAFISILRKIFRFEKEAEKSDEELLSDVDEVILNIDTLIDLLSALQMQDLSTDSEFAASLSKVWRQLTFNLSLVQQAKTQTVVRTSELDKLILAVVAYPNPSEHTLGFYLSEHAGQGWLPFPFMEMLKTLHKDAVVRKHDNTLAHWISLLENARSGR